MKLKIENKEVDASSLIAIGTEGDKAFCVVSPELTLDHAFQLLHTLSLHLLNAYTISANGGMLPQEPTEEQYKKLIAIKSELYDMYNVAVSSVLEQYAPEFELRPDVTADAIAKAEEDIVKKRYSHLSPQEKQRAHRNIQKFKKELLKESFKKKPNSQNQTQLNPEALHAQDL